MVSSSLHRRPPTSAKCRHQQAHTGISTGRTSKQEGVVVTAAVDTSRCRLLVSQCARNETVHTASLCGCTSSPCALAVAAARISNHTLPWSECRPRKTARTAISNGRTPSS